MLQNLLPGHDVSCAGHEGGVGGQVEHVRRADDVVRERQMESVRLKEKINPQTKKNSKFCFKCNESFCQKYYFLTYFSG